jgi:FtsP/CotA-like multicopper oxidase with cupredoxin domain
MQFRVVRSPGRDLSTPPAHLVLPARTPYGEPAVPSRAVSLNEASSRTVRVTEDESTEAIVLDCEEGEPFGPTEAQLGTMNVDGTSHPLGWRDEVTETPAVAATEGWEIHNFTEDAHPIHIHEVQFEVVNRETFEDHMVRGPEPWETAVKDTVIAYPGEITRVKAVFDIPGQFVWHCHIVEHEDNEMMRPLRVGPVQAGQPES